MTPQDFIAAMLPGALASQAANGVPAGFTIAQSAQETGWLKVAPPGNNLFGIKDTPDWTGEVVDEITHEVIGGVREQVTCTFRAYPDFAASIVDHGAFLRANPRYAACFETTNSLEFTQRIAAAGYATDPSYEANIVAIINFHHLTQYDQPT